MKLSSPKHPAPALGLIRSRLRGDDGVAIITVTLVGVAVAGIVAVLTFNTLRNYRESQQERQIGEVLVLAETGLDEGIFELNDDNEFATTAAMPLGLDAAAEEAWVRAQAASLPTTAGANGEYVVVKPEGTDVLYSVAYVPDRATAGGDIRVLKADLLVEPPTPGSPFLPTRGFASSGNLEIGTSPSAGIHGTVGGAHANGILAQGGSATISGCATAFGSNDFAATNPPGCPPAVGYFEPVPAVEPILFHSLSMYDMCNEGVGAVRAGPAYSGAETPARSGQPCSGSLLGVPSAFGWSRSGVNWAYEGGAGVFFVNGGSVDINRDSGVGDAGATIIVAAINEDTLACDETTKVGTVVGGDVDVAGNTQLRPHTSAGDLAIVAGRDIEIQGTADIWGAMLAREQLSFGGTPGANNAIIGSSPCNTPGSPVSKNELFGDAAITYNGGLSIPNYGVVNPVWNVSIDRWSEL
ncbi:MAG: hypothetical protein OER12_01820 [Acidimicrobiia bacterium]|nr:hypothetical protein [Acidimicrobiia bacterium]